MTDTTVATPAATREEAIERNEEASRRAAELGNEAAVAQHKATELRLAADEAKAGKDSPAEKKAREAYQEADDAKAAAAQAERDAQGVGIEATIADAKVLGYGKHEELHAGHHLAQKFGNDPENPRPPTGMPEVTENGMVRLYRVTPDTKDTVYTSCHPEMVGDYMRAGWNRVEGQPGSSARYAADRATAADATSLVDDATNEPLAEDEEEYTDEETGKRRRRKRAKTRASEK